MQPPPPIPTSVEDLLQRARMLQRVAAKHAPAARPLAHKHIALLAVDQASAAARLFHAAATELGADVARIVDGVPAMIDAGEPGKLGIWLGRFYQAIECQGLPPELVARLRNAAAVPVFDGLACDDHPTAALAGFVDGGTQDPESRKYVLQAALVASMT